ncbi:MAG: 2-nitropropane dioxygenase, partial [Myxococcota bacterium]
MPVGLNGIGAWSADTEAPVFHRHGLVAAIQRIRESTYIVRAPDSDRIGVSFGGSVTARPNGAPTFPLLATLPALYPEWLGDRTFAEVHGVRFPYVTGAMANGIATVRMVIAMAETGGLGFFGAAGLQPAVVDEALAEIGQALDGRHLAWGANLIHSPSEPDLEEAIAELYLRRNVRRVSAAAFMRLTPAIVRYAYSGIW